MILLLDCRAELADEEIKNVDDYFDLLNNLLNKITFEIGSSMEILLKKLIKSTDGIKQTFSEETDNLRNSNQKLEKDLQNSNRELSNKIRKQGNIFLILF